MARHMSHAGRGLFVRYMSHRGRISPAHGQERGGLYHPSPASNMLPDNKFRMHKNEECPRMRQSVEHDASGRDIPVFLLEEPEPGIHVAVRDLEQPSGIAVRLVNDAVALR